MTSDRPGIPGGIRRDLIKRFAQIKQQTQADISFTHNAPVSYEADMRHIPDAFCRFDQLDGYKKIVLSQIAAKAAGVGNPFFRLHEGIGGAETQSGGQTLVNFSSYNYLGLSGHPRVTGAAIAAAERYGTSASASRLVAGERPVQRELEEALARRYETEGCIVFVSGHATNVTTIGTLFGPKDLILHDALIHNSVMEGIKLAGSARRSFPHNDYQALQKLLVELRGQFERVMIVVEGLYSMDGDIADLPHLIALKSRYKAFLMVDDAHSFGVLGEKGGGARDHFGLAGSDVDIWMGTLSKALAGCGGYICGSAALIEYLKYNSGGFVYSVGISPMLAAASLEALRVLAEEPERVAALQARGRYFVERARGLGLDTGLSQGYAITPVILGSSLKAVRLSNRLGERGVNVQPIIHPAVEERSARLRFFLSCAHSEQQIDKTLGLVSELI